MVRTTIPVMGWFSLYAKQVSGERWFQTESPVLHHTSDSGA